MFSSAKISCFQSLLVIYRVGFAIWLQCFKLCKSCDFSDLQQISAMMMKCFLYFPCKLLIRIFLEFSLLSSSPARSTASRHSCNFSQSIDQFYRTMDKISDDSFIREEKECEKTSTFNVSDSSDNNFLEDVEVPCFNDTLEEVDYILNLGEKLKKEGKIKFSTPKITTKDRQLSVLMSVDAQSSPLPNMSSLIQRSDTQKRSRLSRLISPINRHESSNGSYQVNISDQISSNRKLNNKDFTSTECFVRNFRECS